MTIFVVVGAFSHLDFDCNLIIEVIFYGAVDPCPILSSVCVVFDSVLAPAHIRLPRATPSAFDAADLESGVHRQETTPAPEAVTEILPQPDAAGYVGIESFEKPLRFWPERQKNWDLQPPVYPDQQSRQQFLVVAPDRGRRKNEWFFFGCLIPKRCHNKIRLSLCIDRLFDENRGRLLWQTNRIAIRGWLGY